MQPQSLHSARAASQQGVRDAQGRVLGLITREEVLEALFGDLRERKPESVDDTTRNPP